MGKLATQWKPSLHFMEGTSFHLSRLATCAKANTKEPEYERRLVREHLGSSYSRLVIPFEADIEHWKQHNLARTLATRIRDHYVDLGLTTVEETRSMSFEIKRGPRGGVFVSIRLPRDVHIIPEGLSSLGRMRLANIAPLQRADTDLAYVPRSTDFWNYAGQSVNSESSPCKSLSGLSPLPQHLAENDLLGEAATTNILSKISKGPPGASSGLLNRRKAFRSKLLKSEKRKRASDDRIIGLADCGDSHDDFILYLDLHNVSYSEIGRQLSRMVQGRLPSDQQALEQDVYNRIMRIVEIPGTATDAEHMVNRIVAHTQSDNSWHFFLKQGVQNSDATSKIDDLPDDPKARAQAKQRAREIAAQERLSARPFSMSHGVKGHHSPTGAARERFQHLNESGYVYERVYTEGPEMQLQIEEERQHLLTGLKKYWHLPIETAHREEFEMADPRLAEAGIAVIALEEGETTATSTGRKDEIGT